MELKLSFMEEEEFPFQAEYVGFGKTSVLAGSPVVYTGRQSKTYTQLLQSVASDLRTCSEQIHVECTAFTEEQEDIAKLVLKLVKGQNFDSQRMYRTSGSRVY